MLKNIDDTIMTQITMPELKDDEAKQITQAYSDMFTALTYTNLLQGKSLGQSWFNAIGQISSFVKTKDKYNSVTACMQRILDQHRKDLAKKMMTDPNRDKIIQVSSEKHKEMTAKTNEMMQAALQTVNKLIEKYRAAAEKLKQKANEEAKKRQQALLKAAQKSQKAQPTTVAAPKQTAAPVVATQQAAAAKTTPAAPQFGPRPQRPVLGGFVHYKAAQKNLMQQQPAAKPAQKPATAAQVTKPAPNNTAAKLANATQKLKTLTAQRARIQIFINQWQNQRTA